MSFLYKLKINYMFCLLMVFALILQASIGISKENDSIESLTHVIIDNSEPAYTVYTGASSDLTEEEFKEMESNVAKAKGITMVEWNIFVNNTDEYIKSKIIINDYKGSKAVDGIVKLVEKNPGIPFGLTLNGGIAFTYNDYQYTKKRYQNYIRNPKDYKPESDQRIDPVNPDAHLGPLLGW